MPDQTTATGYGRTAGSDATGPLLWAMAVVFFGAGDLFTTSLGLASGAVAEGGPVMATVIDHLGLFGMAPMKFLAIGLAYLVWRVTPRPQAHAVPLGLATVGVVVTLWNLQLLSVVGLL